MNGSGRSPAALGRDRALADCPGAAGTGRLPPFHAHTVTVPGAAAGWEGGCPAGAVGRGGGGEARGSALTVAAPTTPDTLHRWGTQTLGQVLAPAIELAEDGFPVSPITAYHWDKGVAQLRASPSGRVRSFARRAPLLPPSRPSSPSVLSLHRSSWSEARARPAPARCSATRVWLARSGAWPRRARMVSTRGPSPTASCKPCKRKAVCSLRR